MAFTVNARVKVADASSQWRGHSGTVKAVSGNAHQVRLDGFSKTGTAPLLTRQLRAQPLASPYTY